MKNKFWKILGISLVSLIIVTSVYAFAIDSIDATWGLIDTNGATGQTWATGPSASSTTYGSPTSTTTDTTDLKNFQDTVTFDWNQVRYGSTDNFGDKSGFGFLGRASVGQAPGQDVPFLVGQFCHFNNPISPPGNAFEYVPLNIELKGIGCEAPYVLDGPDNLSFQYIFNLDETTNQPTGCNSGNYGIGECLCRYGGFLNRTYRNRCDYGPGDPNWPSDGGTYCYAAGDPHPAGGPVGQPGDLNYAGCADRVSITKSTTEQSFDCKAPNDPITKTYYLSLLGFIDKPAGGCPDSPPTGVKISNNLVYTGEYEDNCYCVYAAVTDSQITPVTLKDLAATGVEDGILISWETVTETNNLGFNIMRAESVDGEQVQINSELIMSDLAPGDMFGSAYEYLDKTAVEGVTYYYWLVDVPLDSGDLPGIHGPVSAVR